MEFTNNQKLYGLKATYNFEAISNRTSTTCFYLFSTKEEAENYIPVYRTRIENSEPTLWGSATNIEIKVIDFELLLKET